MRFPGNRLVDQTEHKFRRIRDFLKYNNKKLKGGNLLGTLKKFRKKVAQCQKKSKGGTL